MVCDFLKSRATEEDQFPSIPVSELEPRVLRMGFTRVQLEKTLEEYTISIMMVIPE